MFELSATPLEAIDLKSRFADVRAGGYVTFEGWVRNHNEGREVLRLEYEAYEQLCLEEASRIIAEAEERFDIIQAACAHRTGTLEIGDMAVWVGVSAEHRGPAFDACRYVIDNVKVRLPIWKKEYYTDGDSDWVNCEQCAVHGHAHGA
ncbi:MAG: molybdenum cofactor biosynthesis protein MoaE [Lentisphaeria bacterium]|jgi:molybdopterin synthase catalytic subunit|nr:molybdenum cofactor biosynthesis protein MoaE [Lentisphaeria bacterium]MDP7742325.1 molybdenum cofactor biosynthesis protein MoaE [Lentisphaeria bacterium]